MKNILQLLLLLFFLKVSAQASDTFTSLDYNDNITTESNSTIINLFKVNFNGTSIPINLTYQHNGLQLDESASSVGLHWQIENIGKITRIVNETLDNKLLTGWFNSDPPDFTGHSWIETYDCVPGSGDTFTCPPVITAFPGTDLAPDFFLVRTANDLNFDYLYKKGIQGSPPIPVVLSNFKDYVINTDFTLFPPNQADDRDVVVNIIDTNGDKYSFINGPLNQDISRSQEGDNRNDLYLNSISNPSKTSEILNISYRQTNKQKRVYYGSAYNDCQNNPPDCTNQIIHNVNADNYFVSENRYDIETVTSQSGIINFVYNLDDTLKEIEIKDTNGNYVAGYLFTYFPTYFQNQNLWTIEKYNENKSQAQLIYEFSYFDNNPAFVTNNIELITRDYYGYCNGSGFRKYFPFQSIDSSGFPIPSGDLDPHLTFTKYNSLKTIKNKYSGIIEFDYLLKTDVCSICSNDLVYGGGLLLDSKTINPNTGAIKLIKYNYEGLVGNVVNLSSPRLNMSRQINTWDILWSTKLDLLNTFNFYTQSALINDIQNTGSYFKKVTVSTYDFTTMTLLAKSVKEYEPDPEGISVSPIIFKNTEKDASNNTVKETTYFYSDNISEIVPFGTYRTEVRSVSSLQIKKWTFKAYTPINVINRHLIQKRESTSTSTGSLTKELYISYVNPHTNLIRSASSLSSTGETMEEKFYYPQDTQSGSIPNVNILQSFNRIGDPIKTIKYKNSQKIFEELAEFASDVSTSNLLLPKNIYTSKFPNDLPLITNIGNLERKIKYDFYDINGNLIQYALENGKVNSIIWGYHGTHTLAVIEGTSFAAIPSNLVSDAQAASNISNNESTLLNALEAIRNHPSLINNAVTTYTYKPLVGISTVTDPKGKRVYYTYDSFGVLQYIKDHNNNILSESEYNYKP